MQITFVSNYINHHQIPLSEELYRLTEGSYTFIQTQPMEQERLNMGWDASSIKKPYVKLLYEDEELCKQLIFESDCVIYGGAEREDLIKARLNANKFTIRYSERLYKEGRWKFVSPRGLIQKYKDHTKYRNSNVYLLCAGAYVKGDYNLVFAYPNKKLKFGYFTEFESIEDLNSDRMGNKCTEILWAARFIDWKHPEVMLELAKRLKATKAGVRITMVGDGPLLTQIIDASKDYNDYISFVGSRTPKEVRTLMKQSDIFVSTSDQKEGWGAVVNEAMNSGCVTIAAKEIGVAPYLIRNGINGYMYRACDVDSLFQIVTECLHSVNLRRKIGQNAYNTIESLWNPKVAALRLFDFINDPLHDTRKYKEGPLSKA